MHLKKEINKINLGKKYYQKDNKYISKPKNKI